MPSEQKQRVYIGLSVLIVVLFAAGLLFGYTGRHKSICPGNKPPVAQNADDLGQVTFLCPDGSTVTN